MGLRLTEVRSREKSVCCFFKKKNWGKIAAGLYKDGNDHSE